MSLVSRLQAALKAFTFSGIGGGGFPGPWGWWHRALPGAQYDYRREAGNLWENGIVLACINWEVRTFPEAQPVVETQGTDQRGKPAWQPINDHPLTDLLQNPNEWYDDSVLWAGTLISMAVDGNAYWYKVRSRAGRVVGLHYIPHFMMYPAWPDDGSKFITDYEYHVNGRVIHYPVEDIVHFRSGCNPLNVRKGLSDLAGVLREVCTDNEAATFAAALLRNKGVPGWMLSPEAAGGVVPGEWTPKQAREYKAMFLEQFSGDHRGEPLITGIPMKVQQFSYNPSELLLDKVRNIPEERITAAMGIPAVVVGMGTGLEQSSDRANITTAYRQAWEGCLIPLQRMLGKQMSRQLLADVGGDPRRQRLGWDYSHVKALQDNETDVFAAVTTAYQGGWLRRSEARERANLAWDETDEVYITEVQAAQQEQQARLAAELAPEPAAVEPGRNGASTRALIGEMWRKQISA